MAINAIIYICLNYEIKHYKVSIQGMSFCISHEKKKESHITDKTSWYLWSPLQKKKKVKKREKQGERVWGERRWYQSDLEDVTKEGMSR